MAYKVPFIIRVPGYGYQSNRSDTFAGDDRDCGVEGGLGRGRFFMNVSNCCDWIGDGVVVVSVDAGDTG